MMLDITPYEVGRYYRVPMVRGLWVNGRRKLWPILGPWHEDAEFIGFKDHHYHIDARFISDADFLDAGSTKKGNEVFSLPIQYGDADYFSKAIPGAPVFHLRKCRREWPKYPSTRAPWLPKLEAAYADARIGPGLVCPHRGASLQGLTPVNDCVTCPLHGLRWNCKTGKLAVRTESETT